MSRLGASQTSSTRRPRPAAPTAAPRCTVPRMMLHTLMALLPHQFGDRAARVRAFVLVLRDRPLHRDAAGRRQRSTRRQPRLGVAAPRRSARRSPRGRWRRAAHRRDAAGRRSGRRWPAAAAGACGAAPSATGRGRTPAPRSATSGPNMCSSTSTPSPRTSRMLVTSSRSIALSSWASPRRYTSTATTSTCGSACRHRERRRAGSAADLQHDRRRTCRTTPRCRAVAARARSSAGPPRSGLHAELRPEPVPRLLLAAGERSIAGTGSW